MGKKNASKRKRAPSHDEEALYRRELQKKFRNSKEVWSDYPPSPPKHPYESESFNDKSLEEMQHGLLVTNAPKDTPSTLSPQSTTTASEPPDERLRFPARSVKCVTCVRCIKFLRRCAPGYGFDSCPQCIDWDEDCEAIPLRFVRTADNLVRDAAWYAQNYPTASKYPPWLFRRQLRFSTRVACRKDRCDDGDETLKEILAVLRYTAGLPFIPVSEDDEADYPDSDHPSDDDWYPDENPEEKPDAPPRSGGRRGRGVAGANPTPAN